MKIKKFLIPVLLAGAVPTLTYPLLNKPSTAPNAKKTSPNQIPYDAIHTYIEGQMRRLKIPGASLAIVEGDRIVHFHGFGRAHPGGEAPTPQTPFVLGSTTKSITATAVMQLVEAGKVELNAPVQRYLPWFRVADPIASSQITVRHLLNQTSGLPMIPGMVNLADLDDRPDACIRQARALSSLKLSHAVGTTFEYSNLNYNLLGLIVEAASGETYTDYIQGHIFEPLGMVHSYASLQNAKADGMAVGHRYWFGLPVATRNLPLANGSLPSGQLISSCEDMAHYLVAHLNDGRYQAAQILSSASIQEMQRGVAEQLVLGTPVTTYGMGWFINNIDGVKVIAHGGNVPEFASYMAIIPEQKKGVVLLVNSDQWGLPLILMEVGDGVSALLAGRQPPPIKLGFFPWIMRTLPLIPLFQIAGILALGRRLRSWRQTPALLPGPGRALKQYILPPLVPNLSLAALLQYLRSSGLLRYMNLYMPDSSMVVRISGGLAGIWALVLTSLMLRIVRKPSELR